MFSRIYVALSKCPIQNNSVKGIFRGTEHVGQETAGDTGDPGGKVSSFGLKVGGSKSPE